jgi:hypothetical protein
MIAAVYPCKTRRDPTNDPDARPLTRIESGCSEAESCYSVGERAFRFHLPHSQLEPLQTQCIARPTIQSI